MSPFHVESKPIKVKQSAPPSARKPPAMVMEHDDWVHEMKTRNSADTTWDHIHTYTRRMLFFRVLHEMKHFSSPGTEIIKLSFAP